MASPSAPSERARVRRSPQMASYDRGVIYDILDEGMICHIGFVVDGQPFVIPTVYVRIEDEIFLHGSALSRFFEHAGASHELSVSVTLIDGLVLARAAFDHSMNFRSVVVFGRARLVEDSAERARALAAVVDRFAPGRSPAVRAPNERELKATMVVSLPLAEASAKVRAIVPKDDDSPGPAVWTGVIPLELQALPAEPSPGSALEAPTLGAPFGSR